MKVITIGFSKPKAKWAILAHLIRFYQKTSYSHIYFKFDSETLDRELVYEAVMGGTRFISKPNWSKKNVVVEEFKIDVTDDVYIKMLRFCVDNSGNKYAVMQNVGIVISRLLKLSKNIFTRGVNCSEETAKILELKGLEFRQDLNLITPKDIYRKLTTIFRRN